MNIPILRRDNFLLREAERRLRNTDRSLFYKMKRSQGNLQWLTESIAKPVKFERL